MNTPLEKWLKKAKWFDVYDKPAAAEYTLQEAIAVIEKLKEALEQTSDVVALEVVASLDPEKFD